MVELSADEMLVDERAARRVATSMNIPVAGVIAILIRAKDAELIPIVMPILYELESKFQFYLSSTMLEEARQLSGE